MSNRYKRLGAILTIVWIVAGGYYIYLQNSYQEQWRVVRNICALGSEKDCLDTTKMMEGPFAPEWATIAEYTLLGVLVIWLGLFAMAWVNRGKSD
ncbi:MAG: hypothetical protein EOP17_01245 [Rhizobiaceae bacterium]|nr:MAG: hypothetical protein EOP17_01245 [Rhizobiaceae bacterium]